MGMEFPRTSTIEAADAFVSRMAQMQEEAPSLMLPTRWPGTMTDTANMPPSSKLENRSG